MSRSGLAAGNVWTGCGVVTIECDLDRRQNEGAEGEKSISKQADTTSGLAAVIESFCETDGAGFIGLHGLTLRRRLLILQAASHQVFQALKRRRPVAKIIPTAACFL